MNRRGFVERTLATGAMLLVPRVALRAEQQQDDLFEVSVATLQGRMAGGGLTSRALCERYLSRINQIDRGGPRINSVIELNPDALAIADQRDAERRAGRIRGPLHGIPILIKDNIDTAD